MRRGNQQPRLRSVPAYASTLGDEAIDLAAAAGLILDPWQALVVRDMLGVADDGRWAALETCLIVSRQSGKGSCVEAVELAGLFLFGERLILHSAHEYKTAQEAFLRIKALIDGCADLSRHVKAIREANGEQQVILSDGARLRFVARSKGSARGFSAQRNILDEAYALTFAQIAALMPTMAAQDNAQLNLFSTVPDVDTMPADYAEAVLPGVHKRAVAAAESGSAGRLCYHDWSIRRDELPTGDPTTDADVAEQYIELAYEANPAMGIRITEDYVRGELAALGPAKFATERLSVWPPDPTDGPPRWQVIPEADWLAAGWPDMPSPEQSALAVSVAPDLSRAYIAKAGPIGGGLFGVALLDWRDGISWVTSRLYERAAQQNPLAVVIDRNSAAETIWLEIEARDNNASWDAQRLVDVLTSISPRDECAASTAFYNGVSGAPTPPSPDGEDVAIDPRTVRHREQPELTAAVKVATKKYSGSTWRWDELASDVAALKACSEALFGYLKRQPPMEQPWVWDGIS